MNDAVILSAVRTPGGKAKKGNLKNIRPDDLAAIAMKGALEKAGLDGALVEDVILGCAFPEGEQGMNIGRIAAMRAGMPQTVPGMTVNRFCSSGLQTIAMAADSVKAGSLDCLIAGGVESMSLVPMGGNKYSVNPSLMDSWPESFAGMGITAELVADKYNISRADMDQFATESHQKAAKATESGAFKDEIIPVEIEHTTFKGAKAIKTTEMIDYDDGIRGDTSVEGLGKLRPVFRVGGSVTAGNSSQTTDGAAAAVITSDVFAKEHGLKPIAKFRSFAVKGCAPEIMGVGPIWAIPAALKKAGLTLADIGLIELNEAFAAQSLAVIRELKLNTEIINVNGGAIALGHPLGCSGAKLTATLLSEMQKRGTQFGLVSMCIGGGMGAAGIIELV
ncbi:MAG: thiolase family protein [SAR324 cluster bacterium]|nr:thiolase family protein [SAR324 cluster bacterium]